MALPDDLDADRHAFDRQHRHGYGRRSEDRGRAIEHRIPSTTEAAGGGTRRAKADQCVGQWSDCGEPVLRLLTLQQAQAVIIKRQLTAGLEPLVKCVTVFAGIMLDQIFEAPPVLPIADVRSDRLGLCDAVLEGFDQWIVSEAEHLDTNVAQLLENAIEALPRLGVEPGPSRGFHNDYPGRLQRWG